MAHCHLKLGLTEIIYYISVTNILFAASHLAGDVSFAFDAIEVRIGCMNLQLLGYISLFLSCLLLIFESEYGFNLFQDAVAQADEIADTFLQVFISKISICFLTIC